MKQDKANQSLPPTICSAIRSGLDWAWISRACEAVDVTACPEDAEIAATMAESREPMTHCEVGVFRAIKWPGGQIEVLFTLSDVTFTPNSKADEHE